MLTTAIKSILRPKYNRHIVYVHKWSNFDSVFLINILASLENIEINPIIKDGKIINIQLIANKEDINKKITLHLRDSLLLLPILLRKLAVSFNVESKGIFPYNFVNTNNLNYIGFVPDFSYFYKIYLGQYNE